MDVPLYYVKDAGIGHHWDYLTDRHDHALCGHAYVNPDDLGPQRPPRMCRRCQAKLPEWELVWWKRQALAAEPALERLHAKVEAQAAELRRLADAYRRLKQEKVPRAAPRAVAPPPKRPAVARVSSGASRRRAGPDNSAEAVARRQNASALNPLAAAPVRPPRALIDPRHRVPGGLPGHGKAR